MDKNHSPILGKNQVWPALEFPVMQVVAETPGEQQLSEENLKFGIPRAE
ncbi:hypothetical protein L4D79_22365 [Photobacterium satsumensis]